jgi:hypothetical protein
VKILIAIPACAQLQYGQWESTESPHFDPKNAYLGKGYGERIHISGPNDRIQTIRETWARDVPPPEMDLRFFYGAPDPFAYPVNGIDEVLLNVEDDYAHLPDKVFAICRWAVENDYDWCHKNDDDSYVWGKRLLAEIQHKQWDFGGYSAHIGSISGGPGYWLSRRAMEIVAGSTPHTWAEDKSVEHVLRQIGIRGVELNKTHLCGLANHWIDVDTADLSIAVCAHAVKCEDMRKIYAREHPDGTP